MTKVILKHAAAASIVFSSFASICEAGDERKVGDVSVTLKEPGEYIGEGKTIKKSEGEIVRSYSVMFERISLFRSGNSLLINDSLYEGVASESKVIINSSSDVLVDGKKLKGILVDSDFHENEWDRDKFEIDGIVFEVNGFMVSDFCSTQKVTPNRKKGDKLSMAFGLISITIIGSEIYLWGDLIGSAERHVKIDQVNWDIAIDGKKVNWPKSK